MTSITIAILFIVLGILIKYGKMYFLIAGYNTMSKEEKKKYDVEGIANVFRNVMFGMALMIVLGHFISEMTEIPAVEKYALVTALVIGVPYLIIKANSKRFR